jgi:GT2 family glycosyltransferase
MKKTKELQTEVSGPVITMVVPVWNQLDFTKRLVASVRRYVHVPYKIVFIDNGSGDGTQEYLTSLQKANPELIEVIRNHTNRGFAHATNQGMERVEGHMLWLNNDVELVRPGMIEAMPERLVSKPQLGAVGPVTDLCMGPQQVTQNALYPEFHPCRFLIGFCMLVREDAWKKVGKLDEGFNDAGQDDLDYSIRLRDAGYDLAIVRHAFVHHFGGATQKARFDRYGEQFKQYEQAGRQALIQKWGKEKVEELFLPVDFTGFKVMVSIPAWGSVQPEAYINHMSWFGQESRMSEKNNLQVEFAPMIRSAICCARNELVRQALNRDATHLMFIDDDMIIPQYAISKMVQKNLPILSALCYLRTPPHYPSMFMDPEDGTGKIFYLKDWPKGETIQVDAVGSACVMINTDVFRKIQEMEMPGDSVRCTECGHEHIVPVKHKDEGLWYLYGKARPGEHTVGEDVFFCKLARAAGYPIFVDTAIEFGHVGPPLIYDTEYFERVKEQRRDFPGIQYTDYESARAFSEQPDGLLTPEELKAEMCKRLYAGLIGDGKHPGNGSAAGNKPVKAPCAV